MGANSSIEWTDHTFNPWWGCVKVSPACNHCYAEAWSKRVGMSLWGTRAPRRFFSDAHWRGPIRWNAQAAREGERKRVFCASMADVFEDRADVAPWRERLWTLIAETPWLCWLLLTKRPQNVLAAVPWGAPFPDNVWIGTTVESQEYAAERIPALLKVPARIRFLSCEPMLGPVDLGEWIDGVSWVIAGGESGGRARPMDPAWPRALRDQCIQEGVPFHFKQWGDWRPGSKGPERLGKKLAGRVLDGRTWNGVPDAGQPAPARIPA